MTSLRLYTYQRVVARRSYRQANAIEPMRGVNAALKSVIYLRIRDRRWQRALYPCPCRRIRDSSALRFSRRADRRVGGKRTPNFFGVAARGTREEDAGSCRRGVRQVAGRSRFPIARPKNIDHGGCPIISLISPIEYTSSPLHACRVLLIYARASKANTNTLSSSAHRYPEKKDRHPISRAT